LASEASGCFKTFYIKNRWSVFCNKHFCLYSALAVLDFIYSNQEKCHLHAIASNGFAIRGVVLHLLVFIYQTKGIFCS